MNTLNCSLTHISILACASQLFFASVMGADTQKFDHVLLIGRPQAGGVKISQVPKHFSNIKENTIWYLDPRSGGDSSITGAFPCPIPDGIPQQFDFVCIEQGMLNEVVAHFRSQASSSVESTSLPKYTGSSEDVAELSKLDAERKVIWQKWDHSRQVMVSLEKRIIRKAILANLISESFEFGHVYYRLIGDRNTSIGTVIVDKLFAAKKGCMPVEEEEYHNLSAAIDEQKRQLDEIDASRDTIIKRRYEEEMRFHEEQRAISEQSIAAASQAPGFALDQRAVKEHIDTFVHSAWNLVRPGGAMIVFSRNARIDGTPLTNGIARDYLESILVGYDRIEEISFPAQTYEGEHYISNPVFPATTDSFNWAGWRDEGSYFLIQKAL